MTPLHLWSSGPLLVCVPADLPASALDALRATVAEHPSVDPVLDVLTAGGLAATPPFVCAEAVPEGVRIVIRGELEVQAHGTDGTTLTLGAGRAATWNDDVVTDIARLSVGGADGSCVEWVPTLPAPSGVAADPALEPGGQPAPTGPAPTVVGAVPAPAEGSDDGPEDDAGDDAAPLVGDAPDPSPAADAGAAVSDPALAADPSAAEEAAAEVPAGTPDSHTLDEAAFLELVAANEQSEPDPPAAPDPVLAEERDAPADALDFSGLLEQTSHGEPTPAAPAAPPPPPPLASPAVEPVPEAPSSTTPALPPAVEPVPPPPGAAAPPVGVAPPPPGVPPIAAVPTPAAPAGAGTGLGEHDGRTMTLADLRRLQDAEATPPATTHAEAVAAALPPPPGAPGGAPLPPPPGAPAATEPTPPPPPPPPPPPAPGPTAPEAATQVRAVRCPAGHPSPPGSAACVRCGQPIVDTGVVTIARPVVARLVFDSGLIVDVDRPQLIGRRPTSPPDAAEIPNLVTLPSPDSDLSRAHTAVRVEGWDVLVEDLRSTNGTEVRLPGQEAVRLREHEPVLVVPGTQVTMAGTVRFRVEAPEG